MKTLFGQIAAAFNLSGNEIIRARKVENKIKWVNRKMADKGINYRMRLAAIIACDCRPGIVWAC